MVAITVILAAVIGAFVLEIGDQQETAPSTSFDSEQSTQYYQKDASFNQNLTTIGITHAGGNVIDYSNVDVKVEGNGSVFGVKEDRPSPNRDVLKPVPDITRTLGTNEPVQFSSGQEWEMIGYNGDFKRDAYIKSNEVIETRYSDGADSDQKTIQFTDDRGGWRFANQIDSGENVNVVWEASSGGKTQSLFRYTVQ
jgi:hypothetical protein